MARNEKHVGGIFGSTSKIALKMGHPVTTAAGSVVVIILINIDKAHTGRINLEIGGGREGVLRRVECSLGSAA